MNDQDQKKINTIGFIMDGNRRWAKKNEVKLEIAYQKGSTVFLEVISACLDKNISHAIFYALSEDNFRKRSQEEITIIYKIGFNYLDNNLDFFVAQGIKCNFIGNRKEYSPESLQKIKNIEKKTNFLNPTLQVHILLVYDPYADLKAHFKKTLHSSKDIPPIDLIIRTGGNNRLSGFLPVQSMYANIITINYFWPEIKKKYITQLLNKAALFQNNYGK
jgi:undecaprenyl diphosphate synthase